MTLSRILKSALAGIALMALAAPASADQLADIKAAGKIVTATDMHYAPFDMLIDGVYQGMTKDLFDEVSKELGVEPVYQDIPWTAELPGLEVKKFDIVIAPVTITPERIERYTFTLPIADATVSLVRAANNTELKKPEDIKGKTVGVQQGTAQFRQLQAFGEKLGGVTVKEYGTTDEAYADLAAGRLDAVAGSLPNLTYLVKNRGETFALFEPASFGEPTYFAWVLRKGDDSESFSKAIADAVIKMTKDGRVKAIQEKWLGSYTELPLEVPTK
ncbi:transporter substrate-binding domain-containing protein [Aquamicrobium lusatiense]|jgi:polar amino acid transport system substrate-binding protein|uniref:Polar amino acid transport system substrate-binding protein n=1 Tax=Aquamicrobium lusatiense TaxID=89772 RepID=A0A7W9VWL0_9HYPH|nr:MULTISPECIES: transporter substrate-binding domain-containing protein [Aquamicrobium]MBB6014223.1 polar amino acid transport system substrate-binding protein [Aquamicrobium lusatiense]MCK9551899.1 transporter substrate-binding domain-containing protein [Aquamicrobium sp.]MDH4989491.1 transporter substrate-binding domain-containing protein [Aquamicrobium lusatiense]